MPIRAIASCSTDYKKTAVAKERLGIMEQTSDGFKIAEKDLEIRGQGEILGTRQSGIQNFQASATSSATSIFLSRHAKKPKIISQTDRLSPETSAMVKIARSDKNVRSRQASAKFRDPNAFCPLRV